MLLSFDCYLRISEMSSLQTHHVTDLKNIRGAEEQLGTLISLAHCKTGNNQSVRVQRGSVISLIELWARYVKDKDGEGAMLFPPEDVFRNLMHEAQRRLGWAPHHHFVPHSFRHGGATTDYLSVNSRLEDILFRGRWASLVSTRRYIQEGPALMAAAARSVPGWQRDFARQTSAHIQLFLYPYIPDPEL